MTTTNLTYWTRAGEHCKSCGSLVGACTDQQKCHDEAGFHIEAAIRSGNTQGCSLLETAHILLGQTVLELRNRHQMREATTSEITIPGKRK